MLASRAARFFTEAGGPPTVGGAGDKVPLAAGEGITATRGTPAGGTGAIAGADMARGALALAFAGTAFVTIGGTAGAAAREGGGGGGGGREEEL